MEMKGSRNSAILFFVSGVLLIIQAGISGFGFEDGIGALAAGVFAFVMFLLMFMAYVGGLSAVMDTTTVSTDNYDGTKTITTYSRDTGQRVQMTPCCGICGGIAVIIVAAMFSEGLGELVVFLIPGFLGGLVAILAAIVFAIEYKGPWTRRAF
ncbi:MAG: membrane protein of unknown function [Candidatus Thorarchaeota archaeon]|nr:MAG: membrane protein of unknown function [Candidatus Thorarchaeota archaeon]